MKIYGSFDAHSSYGLHTLAALNHFVACYKFAYRISDDIVERPAIMRSVDKCSPADRGGHGLTLQISPPDVKVHGPTVVWTMTESAGLFPDVVCNLNRAMAVVVPNNWCAEVFSAAGVTVPIHVVGLGVNHRVFCHKTFREREFNDPVVIGWSGSIHGAGARKNLQTAIDAFRYVRIDHPMMLLIRILPSNPPPYFALTSSPDRTVSVTTNFISEPELSRWYRRLDYFLSTSSGEAVNLSAVQALACGTRLISPIHAGVGSYATEKNSIPIQYDLCRRHDLAQYYPGLMADIHTSNVMNALKRAVKETLDDRHSGLATSWSVEHMTWQSSMQGIQRVLSLYSSECH